MNPLRSVLPLLPRMSARISSLKWTLLLVAIGGFLVTSGIGYIKDRFNELTSLRGEKTATVQELAQLKELLSEKQRKAVDKGIVRQATVVRTVVSNRETVHADGQLCEDWVDPDGRFHWHADTRRLEVTQKYAIKTSIIETATGRIYADTVVYEVGPKNGIHLRLLSTERREILIAGKGYKRPRTSFLIGAQATLNGYSPYLRAEYRFLGPFVAGVEVTDEGRAYLGWRREF